MLEEQLGVRLFDRYSRDVSPTLFGQRVLTLGSRLLEKAAHLERDLELHKELGTGEITIGSGPFPAELFLGAALGRFCSKYPRLHVRVTVDILPRLYELLRNSEIDIMVADTRGIEDKSDLTIVDLPRYQGYFFCRVGHPLSAQGRVALTDILRFPQAQMWLPEGLLAALLPEENLELSGFRAMPNGLVECSNLKIMLDTVIASDAIGLTLGPIYPRQVDAGEIVLLPFAHPEFWSSYDVVTVGRYSLAPAVEAFREDLIEAAGDGKRDWSG